jgi:excisionase family DNA binding protein
VKPLLTVRDVASLLRCSTGSVYRAALKKEIPSLRTPGGVRFDEEDLARWLEEKKIEHGRPA